MGLVVSEGVFGLGAAEGTLFMGIEVTIICFEDIRANGEPGREVVGDLPLEAAGVVVMDDVMLGCGTASDGAVRAVGEGKQCELRHTAAV